MHNNDLINSDRKSGSCGASHSYLSLILLWKIARSQVDVTSFCHG
ncbi:hypothetical protein [Nostoc sphaeroides]|nr:hypothetical protein [Nostoc sphaeroides]